MSKTIQIPYIDLGVSRVCTLDVCDLARRAADPTADLGDAPSAWMLAGLIAHNDAGEYTLTPRGEDLLASIDTLTDDPVPEAAKMSTCTTCEGKGERPVFTSTYTCEDCNGTGEHAASPFRFNGSTGRTSASEPTTVSPPVCADDVVRALHTAEGHVYLYGATKRYKEEIKRAYQPGCSFAYSPACPEGPGWYAMSGTQRCPAAVSADIFERLVSALRKHGVPVNARPGVSEWVLIDSEEVARSFVGKRVQVDATAYVNAHDAAHAHYLHGKTMTVARVDHGWLMSTECHVLGWQSRGNVHLRVVES